MTLGQWAAEDRAAARLAEEAKKTPQGVKAVLNVSVVAQLGMMTGDKSWRPGQRDDWEVTVEGENLCLRGPAPERALLTVNWEALVAAVTIRKDYQR